MRAHDGGALLQVRQRLSFSAAHDGEYRKVQALLDNGSSVTANRRHGRTP